MKTIAEQKFDTIIKDCFLSVLKPLGFKKKANNFYRQLPDLGQIVNVQKSMFYSKEHISFTINTGIFIPEYWLVYYDYHDGNIPEYPTESACAIRQRIGDLRYKRDTWFEISSDTDIEVLKRETSDNVTNYIIPYFEKNKNKTNIVNLLEDKSIPLSKFARLIIYGEYKNHEKAQTEFDLLKKDNFILNNLKSSLDEYQLKYNLND